MKPMAKFAKIVYQLSSGRDKMGGKSMKSGGGGGKKRKNRRKETKKKKRSLDEFK